MRRHFFWWSLALVAAEMVLAESLQTFGWILASVVLLFGLLFCGVGQGYLEPAPDCGS